MTSTFIVLDASAAIKAVLPNPLQAHCLALVQTFTEVQPAAPALWAHETTSAIAKAVHFGEITENEARQSLEKLDALRVHLFVADADQNRAAFDWTIKLKRASAFDSYYLVLAQFLECDFWTADKHLFNALKDSQLEWLHWIEELVPPKED
jgi:predicted nucleic acid-binding protein